MPGPLEYRRRRGHAVGKRSSEIGQARALVSHREKAYLDALSESNDARVIRRRWEKLVEAREWLDRCRRRRR